MHLKLTSQQQLLITEFISINVSRVGKHEINPEEPPYIIVETGNVNCWGGGGGGGTPSGPLDELTL